MLPHGFEPGTPGPEGPGVESIFGAQPPQRPQLRGLSTTEERSHALYLLASGMTVGQVATSLGRSAEAIRQWRSRAKKKGTPSGSPITDATAAATGDSVPSESGSTAPDAVPSSSAVPHVPQRAPKDPGAGLGEHEVEAILDLKRNFPSMGPAQIRAQLKRFKGRLGVRPIKRVLERHGFETVHVGSRPQGEEEPKSWEAPHRNAIWQLDFADRSGSRSWSWSMTSRVSSSVTR